eukprot:gnl/MRDRNA2_/MRDRNA2_14948_c0_seq1.p1 gnl/MRDRNA2_/MRDRNA2_14948_c0~~gnl/MRDRNA2_/MRDRNA2_14948_c0_seq1.p1  ORF type:complete len:285 (+),score=78.95 gnl/MRDRNA2_/MRDRNA2_14948_c0_seq1:80-934(+)
MEVADHDTQACLDAGNLGEEYNQIMQSIREEVAVMLQERVMQAASFCASLCAERIIQHRREMLRCWSEERKEIMDEAPDTLVSPSCPSGGEAAAGSSPFSTPSFSPRHTSLGNTPSPAAQAAAWLGTQEAVRDVAESTHAATHAMDILEDLLRSFPAGRAARVSEMLEPAKAEASASEPTPPKPPLEPPPSEPTPAACTSTKEAEVQDTTSSSKTQNQTAMPSDLTHAADEVDERTQPPQRQSAQRHAIPTADSIAQYWADVMGWESFSEGGGKNVGNRRSTVC